MPIYDFHCPHCTAVLTRILTMAEMQEAQFCDECGNQLDLVPSVPARVTPGSYGKGGGLPPREANR